MDWWWLLPIAGAIVFVWETLFPSSFLATLPRTPKDARNRKLIWFYIATAIVLFMVTLLYSLVSGTPLGQSFKKIFAFWPGK